MSARVRRQSSEELELGSDRNPEDPTSIAARIQWPRMFLGALPKSDFDAANLQGWPAGEILDDLTETDPSIASEVHNSLSSKRLQWIDEAQLNLLEIANQYCRFAYVNNCDLLVLTGRILPVGSLDILSRFSARFTIVAQIEGSPDSIEGSFEDQRTGKSSQSFGLILSPYRNILFDLDAGVTLEELKTTFRREHVTEALKVGISVGPGLQSMEVTADEESCLVPTNSALLPEILSGLPSQAGWRALQRAVVLFDRTDVNAFEIDGTVRDASRNVDPKLHLLELGEKYQSVRLTPRERNALELLAQANWEDVAAPNPVAVFRLPRTCSTDQEIQYRALSQWLPVVNNFIAIARAKGAERAAELLEEIWDNASNAMLFLEDLPNSERRSSDLPSLGSSDPGAHLVFSASLTSTAGDQLEHAFERQARLLTVLNRLSQPKVSLEYSIGTHRDAGGNLQPRVTVECWAQEATQIEAAALRSSLGELVHSTFVGIHGLSFSFDESKLEAPDRNPKYRARVSLKIDDRGVAKISSFPDWAQVLDFMCSLDKPAALRLTVRPLDDSTTPGPLGLSADSDSHSSELESMLRRVSERVGARHALIGLEVELSSHDPMPTALLDLVCAEVGGDEPCDYEEAELEAIPQMAVPIPQALRVFHPPFGSWYSASSRRPLTLASPVSAFPVGGIELGRATLVHAKADTRVPVRMPDEDRLRHLYVIGRTGSGKTNLLRGLVAQELGSPSTGLAIVDPHGDLAGHAINLLPRSRLADLAVLDFSDPDLTPVLNPLLINRESRLARSRLSQEILEILKARIFHEFSGPRFDAIIRLLLDTLLDAGYPAVPSLVDASLLLTDDRHQRHIRSQIQDDELKSRWAFHDKLKGGKDYYDLLDWVVSKLDDLAQDDTLRSVLGGESNTVDIERVVKNNGILVVSIPESVIGRSTAEFIGSLVLLHFKNALFQRPITGSVPFYLYVDEFQRFAGVGFEDLLAEARKFGVGLVMAHQNIEQLRSFSPRTGQSTNALLNSILGNVGTMVIFPIGAQDAELLSSQLELAPRDVARISRYEAVVKMTLEGHQLAPFTISTDYAEPGMDPRRLDEIREYMARHSLMVQRDSVAEQIVERRRTLSPPRSPSDGNLQGAGRSRSGMSRRDPSDVRLTTEDDEIPSEKSSFLDEWLRKRREVEAGPRLRASTDASTHKTVEDGVHQAASSEAPPSSWSQIIGPVMRIEAAARVLGRSPAQLRSDAKRGKALILTTHQGTEVLPASHILGSSLVPGLSQVFPILERAPFGAWTRAAWLASPSPGLGGISPLAHLRTGGDPDLVLPLVESYAEEF